MKLFKEIKWAFQRIKRGYSDRDVWDISYWFENTVVSMLEQLKETKISFPTRFNSPEEWDNELSNMIKYFKEMSENYCSEKNEYEDEYVKHIWDSLNSEEPYDSNEFSEIKNKYYERDKEINEYRIKMKNEAFKLLSKYYYDLWD